MSLSDRIDSFRDRLFDLGETVSRKFTDVSAGASRGDHKQAIACLERGRKCYNKREYARAEEYFREAVFADERYAKAHYLLGLVLYKQDDAKGAVRSWKRAMEVQPGDAAAEKARRKIGYVEGRVNRTINELEERLGRK